jgi:hypothetical protein
VQLKKLLEVVTARQHVISQMRCTSAANSFLYLWVGTHPHRDLQPFAKGPFGICAPTPSPEEKSGSIYSAIQITILPGSSPSVVTQTHRH